LTELAKRCADFQTKTRLLILATFCRAHASRLMARLSAFGRGPLPVPPEDLMLPPDVDEGLRREASIAAASASRYRAMAELAREKADLSSAWVCELNRKEEEDRARELAALAESHGAAASRC
jgi:hypothetical protein